MLSCNHFSVLYVSSLIMSNDNDTENIEQQNNTEYSECTRIMLKIQSTIKLI